MKLPHRLKIGGHVFTINEEYEGNLEPAAVGKTDWNKSAITVSKDLAPTHKLQTLIHETLHAINGELSETDVEFLSQAITQVIIDNKKTIKTLVLNDMI